MKAIRVNQFGPPEVLQLEDVPDLTPGPGQVLVAIEAAGVNPVETYIRAGAYGQGPRLPYTPGTDAAGIVELVGKGVSGLAVGDRVYSIGSLSGTYAEKALFTPDQLFPLAAGLTFQQGAGIGVPYRTAYRALIQKAHAQPGETVFVHGASGGVGLAAVQIAVAHGMKVIGTAGSEQGRRLVLEQGADHALDHHAEDYLDELLDLTGGAGPAVILEMLANVNLSSDLKVLAPFGRVVVIGSRGKIEIDPRDLMSRDGTITSMRMPNAPPLESERIQAALGAGLANGTLRPVVGEAIALADAARAHRRLHEGKATGKIVLMT